LLIEYIKNITIFHAPIVLMILKINNIQIEYFLINIDLINVSRACIKSPKSNVFKKSLKKKDFVTCSSRCNKHAFQEPREQFLYVENHLFRFSKKALIRLFDLLFAFNPTTFLTKHGKYVLITGKILQKSQLTLIVT